MCFHCPADLPVEEPGATLRFRRIAEDVVAPADVTRDPQVLAEFEAGQRFLMVLQVTAYVQNRPVVTEELHGIVESDLPGEVACVFEDPWAVGSLVRRVRETAVEQGYLRQGVWVL